MDSRQRSANDSCFQPCCQPQGLSIPYFCDMKRFDKMLKDWAQSTGLATVAVGSDGKYISGYYNFTDFCEKLTRGSPEGLRRCVECDRKGYGTYLCHAGLVDFAAPITLEDGTRIYHAGDTAVHAEMALIGELYAPDIALLPIGDLFTMSPREAAVAARMLKPRWIVPAHYGTFPALTGTPEMLREELKKLGLDAQVVALRPGETLE